MPNRTAFNASTPSSLFINQFFWPETAATAQLLTDVARMAGPATVVLCAPPSYAGVDETHRPPVKILYAHRRPFRRNRIGRLAAYASFLTRGVWKALQIPSPDVVLTLTTPPLASLIGSALKCRRKTTRHIIWEMDLYPDVASDLGYLSNPLLTHTMRALCGWSRQLADQIIVLGEEMKLRLVSQGIPEQKIHVVENWADGSEIIPQPFPEGTLVTHYSGNLGLAHETETIGAAIRTLAKDPSFHFVFAGGGPGRGQIPALSNVTFRSYVARAELGKSLAEGHLGLVTQLPQTCGAIVPSKTYGIMAAGRPILYIGPKAATPARIIEKYRCGWQIDPGDTTTLVRLLERLQSDRSAIREAGARARAAFDQNYDKPQGVARILNILHSSALSAPSVV